MKLSISYFINVILALFAVIPIVYDIDIAFYIISFLIIGLTAIAVIYGVNKYMIMKHSKSELVGAFMDVNKNWVGILIILIGLIISYVCDWRSYSYIWLFLLIMEVLGFFFPSNHKKNIK